MLRISISYASISDSLYALLHCLFAMKPFTSSGSFRLQCSFRCLNRFPVASIVVSAYAFFFMYHNVFGMLQYSFVGDAVALENCGLGNVKIVGDAVALGGDDVAVPV